MFSPLDTRYFKTLGRLHLIVGEENFVRIMAIWSITYAECTNGITVPMYSIHSNLYDRVKEKEKIVKHQMVALLQVLQEDHPTIRFHFGLTSEDIMHQSRNTQVCMIINEINTQLALLEKNIVKYEEQISFPVLAHTHGQPATPIMIGQYLRAKGHHIPLVKPLFRLGGSNGQLTILKLAQDIDVGALAESWLQKTLQYIPEIVGSNIVVPDHKEGLLQIGPANEATFMSGMSVALKLRALSRALWDHCTRGILCVAKDKNQAGSSAMPHKINPIAFENAEGSFTIAHSILDTAMQANADSRGLRDLSNSIVNRNMIEGWCYLYLGLNSLNQAMASSEYSKTAAMAELEAHPECLTELLRYYMMIEGSDPYWDLKSNPPTNFKDTVSLMNKWSLGWPKD